jgi:hypothetical protein
VLVGSGFGGRIGVYTLDNFRKACYRMHVR